MFISSARSWPNAAAERLIRHSDRLLKTAAEKTEAVSYIGLLPEQLSILVRHADHHRLDMGADIVGNRSRTPGGEVDHGFRFRGWKMTRI